MLGERVRPTATTSMAETWGANLVLQVLPFTGRDLKKMKSLGKRSTWRFTAQLSDLGSDDLLAHWPYFAKYDKRDHQRSGIEVAEDELIKS